MRGVVHGPNFVSFSLALQPWETSPGYSRTPEQPQQQAPGEATVNGSANRPQTPFSDQLSIHMEGGEWQVDATHNSLIAAGNGNTKPVKAALTLFYDHGQSRYTIEKTLQPEEQMWIDLGQIIRNRVPDKDGKMLPSGLTMGSYQLMEVNPTTLGSLYEGKVVIDKTFGHAAYGCMTCCGVGYGQFSPDPWGRLVGDSAPGNIGSQDACSGFDVPTTHYYSTWWSDNSGIIAAAYSNFTAVGAGLTNGYAQGTIPTGDGVDVGRTGHCPASTDRVQQQTNACQVNASPGSVTALCDGTISLAELDVGRSSSSPVISSATATATTDNTLMIEIVGSVVTVPQGPLCPLGNYCFQQGFKTHTYTDPNTSLPVLHPTGNIVWIITALCAGSPLSSIRTVRTPVSCH